MQLLTTTTHSLPVNKGRVENLYSVKTVVRKRNGGNRRRYSSALFLSSNRNRNDWKQNLLTKCEQPMSHSDNYKQPVDKCCSGSVARIIWIKPRINGVNDEDDIKRHSATISSGEAHVVLNDHHIVADINGYYPVRRRILMTGKSDDEKTTTTEVDDKSLSKHYNQLHRELYWPLQWFTNLCRPKPSLFITAGDRHPQNHHHRILHRHRSNHHHTHHMWTSSCCWWLLVLYAAIVVVASFARAAHSAKDGKYILVIIPIINLGFFCTYV